MPVEKGIIEIVGRCRRIGWDVETPEGRRVAWAYRVKCGDGAKVTIHGTPSDIRWKSNLMAELNRHGFREAEAAWKEQDALARAEKIRKDKAAADRKALHVTKKAASHNAALTLAAGPRAIHDPDYAWLSTPTDVPETRIMRTTPDLARKMVAEMNSSNRPIRPSHIEFLASMMENGEWSQTHQGGAIDWNGTLQDGQHRLLAVIKANREIIMPWTVGADPANFGKVDVGSARTGRDLAVMRGTAYATVAPSAARLVLQIDMYGAEVHLRLNKVKISIDRVQRAIESYGEEFMDVISTAYRIRSELRVNAAGVAVALYMITRKMPKGDPRLEKFIEDLGAPVDSSHLDDLDPVKVLRRLILRSHDTKAGGGARRSMRALEVAAYVLKAWNYRATGKAVTIITWRNNEYFPATVIIPPPTGAAFGESETN